MSDKNGELRKIKKIGSGTYGKVYEAMSPGGSVKAVKCNTKSESDDFIGCVRELNVNNRLSGHPFIIPLTQITDGNPFSNGIMSPDNLEKGYTIDKLHFVYPLAECNLREYMNRNINTITILDVKRFMVDILLGMEYIHGTGYIHRDIKEENLLVMKDLQGLARIRIADFGHSKPFACGMKQTPGLISAWWRAPEVVTGSTQYTQLADMWSVGCVFYTMITGKPLTGIIGDNNSIILNAILDALPYHVSSYDVSLINCSKLKVILKSSPVNMETFLNVNQESIKQIDLIGGYQNFVTMLMGLLSFKQSERWTATKALNSPFFTDYTNVINTVREKFPPVEVTYPKIITISNPSENEYRKSIMCIVYGAYLGRNRIPWYSDRILFHSISFFDLMLAHIIKNGQTSFLTKKRVELMYYSCLYFSIKYFSSVQVPISYSLIVEDQHKSTDDKLVVENFERMLLEKVLVFDVYRDTPYDIMCKNTRPVDEEIHGMLILIMNGVHSGLTPVEVYRNVWLQNKSVFVGAGQQLKKTNQSSQPLNISIFSN